MIKSCNNAGLSYQCANDNQVLNEWFGFFMGLLVNDV